MDNVKTKACCKCKKVLPVTTEYFYKQSKGKGRQTLFSSTCKPCKIEYNRQYKKSQREAIRRYEKKNRKVLKDYISRIKDCGCQLCGYNQCNAALEFHHYGEDKAIEISKVPSSWSISRLQKEINKCLVVCANCHREIHAGVRLIEVNSLFGGRLNHIVSG